MPFWTIEPVIDERELDDVLEVEVASFSNPWTREMYLWELRNPEVSHLHVLRTGDRLVVGFVGFWIVFDELHLNNLAVRPEYRGRGFGAALLTHVLTEGARLGARQAALEVRRSNEAARRLYERFGFELVGLRPKYYARPEEDALVLMKRHLFHAEDSSVRTELETPLGLWYRAARSAGRRLSNAATPTTVHAIATRFSQGGGACLSIRRP